MTPERYRYCLETLRLSQRALSPLLVCSERLPRLWAIGRQTIPPKVADWLERCVAVRERYPDPPPPHDWRRTNGPVTANEGGIIWRVAPRHPPQRKAAQKQAKRR